jgi:hypothetical protein
MGGWVDLRESGFIHTLVDIGIESWMMSKWMDGQINRWTDSWIGRW